MTSNSGLSLTSVAFERCAFDSLSNYEIFKEFDGSLYRSNILTLFDSSRGVQGYVLLGSMSLSDSPKFLLKKLCSLCCTVPIVYSLFAGEECLGVDFALTKGTIGFR